VLKGIREPERIVEVGYTGGPPPRRPHGQRAAPRRGLLIEGGALLVVAAGLLGAAVFAWQRPPLQPLVVELRVASERADAPMRRFPAAPPIRSNDLFRFDAHASRACFLRIVAFDPDDGCQILGSSGGSRVAQLSVPSAAGRLMRISGSAGHRMVVAIASDKPIEDGQLLANLSLSTAERSSNSHVTWFNAKGLLHEPENRSFEEVAGETGLSATLSAKGQWLSRQGLVFEGVAFARQ
jgi:hypothetical protein